MLQSCRDLMSKVFVFLSFPHTKLWMLTAENTSIKTGLTVRPTKPSAHEVAHRSLIARRAAAQRWPPANFQLRFSRVFFRGLILSSGLELWTAASCVFVRDCDRGCGFYFRCVRSRVGCRVGVGCVGRVGRRRRFCSPQEIGTFYVLWTKIKG